MGDSLSHMLLSRRGPVSQNSPHGPVLNHTFLSAALVAKRVEARYTVRASRKRGACMRLPQCCRGTATCHVITVWDSKCPRSFPLSERAAPSCHTCMPSPSVNRPEPSVMQVLASVDTLYVQYMRPYPKGVALVEASTPVGFGHGVGCLPPVQPGARHAARPWRGRWGCWQPERASWRHVALEQEGSLL